MRFNVHGFDQKVAIEFGLSNDELLILRHFEDFVCSGKMESFYEEGHMFYWVNYNKFLEDLPILNINKERLGNIMLYELGTKPLDFNERIKNYSETTRKAVLKRKYTGLLKNKTLRNSEVGVRSYFSFSEIFYKLKLEITNCDQAVTHPIKISEGSNINMATHPIKISEPIQYKNGNKDYSIKDYSIKDNIPSNKKTNNKPKTDYLDLTFLDLDIEKVKLTKDEYGKLISKFGKKYIHDKIVSLENYIVNGKGSRYKSHYRALLTWGNGDVGKGVPEVTKAKNPLSGFKEL